MYLTGTFKYFTISSFPHIGAHLLDQVSTWTMAETGYLATHQGLRVESLLLAPQTFQYMVTVHRVTAMYDISSVVTGPSGSPRGRLQSPLEQLRHVCVPPLPPGWGGSGSGQRDPRSLDDSSSAPRARERVVRGPPTPPNPTSTSTTAVGSTATPTPLPQVPRRRPHPEPSRVASLQRLLGKSGFSREAAHEMSKMRQGVYCMPVPVAMALFL